MKMQLLLAVLLLTIISVAATAGATTELLYVQTGRDLVSYRVNSKTAVTTKLGTLKLPSSLNYPVQVFHAPTSAFVYVLGFTSATEEFFWVYDTTSTGEVSKLVQALSVKPALSQFVFFRNGSFGYALFSWTSVSENTEAHAADLVLFTVDTKTGKLTDTTKNVEDFPANLYWLTSLNGLIGSTVYTRAFVNFDDSSGYDYYSYAINPKTGRLTGAPQNTQNFFWQDNYGVGPQGESRTYSSFSNALIAQASTNGYTTGTTGNAISIYSNDAKAWTSKALINCTSAMEAACGDSVGVQFDPSGKYLFLSDATVNKTVITAINRKEKTLKETASIPGAYHVAFSPDGTMVYAIGEKEVLVDVFNPASGELTAESAISISNVQSITPAQ
jgi:6-phosphogluconolactonase (cycloisomerase 2 family)